MKATKIFKGVTLFVLGMVVTFGIVTSNRHNDFNKHAGIRKRRCHRGWSTAHIKTTSKRGVDLNKIPVLGSS